MDNQENIISIDNIDENGFVFSVDILIAKAKKCSKQSTNTSSNEDTTDGKGKEEYPRPFFEENELA